METDVKGGRQQQRAEAEPSQRNAKEIRIRGQ